jgi:hypothetical protein
MRLSGCGFSKNFIILLKPSRFDEIVLKLFPLFTIDTCCLAVMPLDTSLVCFTKNRPTKIVKGINPQSIGIENGLT